MRLIVSVSVQEIVVSVSYIYIDIQLHVHVCNPPVSFLVLGHHDRHSDNCGDDQGAPYRYQGDLPVREPP